MGTKSRYGSLPTNYDGLKARRLSAERKSHLKNRFRKTELRRWYSNRHMTAKLNGDFGARTTLGHDRHFCRIAWLGVPIEASRPILERMNGKAMEGAKFLNGKVAGVKATKALLPLECLGVVYRSGHGGLVGKKFAVSGDVATSRNYPANQARAD